MKTIAVKFRNIPLESGGFLTATVEGCLVANNGSPTLRRPQIIIHLPKNNQTWVDGGFVDYDGRTYHVIGVTARQMDANTPSPWDRYAIAEEIKAFN